MRGGGEGDRILHYLLTQQNVHFGDEDQKRFVGPKIAAGYC